MTDDLKERMLARLDPRSWDPLCAEAVARITDLEARLAAAVEVQDRLMSERYQHYLRAEAAEAGEDALAEALRGATETLRGASRQLTEVHRGNLKGRVWGQMTLEIVSAALAAYEARRKG